MGKEFERRGVLKGEDGVLLGEFLGQRDLEAEEVGAEGFGERGGGLPADEECLFGVFLDLGGAGVEGSFGTGVFGFSGGGLAIDFSQHKDSKEE